MTTSWDQVKFSLKPRSKGSYLVTDEILENIPQIKDFKIGNLNLFLQHTSAAISLNENWDSDVRKDMTNILDKVAPEDPNYFHTDEGLDDMPGHAKSSIVGCSLDIPISNGRLATGTWQGIWFMEFRTYRHTRNIVATINGLKTN